MDSIVQIGLTNAVMATGLAVVAAAVARLCRRPALGHALWLLVLLKLITPPLVVIPIALPEPAKEDEPVALVELSPLPAEREVPAVAPDQAQRPPAEEPLPAVAANVVEVADPFVAGRDWRDLQPVPQNADGLPAEALAASGVDEVAWRGLVGGVWLAGSAIWFLIALTRIGRFHRLLRASQPGPTGLQQETNGLALQMGLRDCPGIWLIPGVLSPLLWAVYGCPRLLFPVGLLQRVNDVQRRTLLAHELAHYRRRDHWVRCLEFLALGLYWWFPLAWWARRELREAEEECCDAWVIWTLPDAAKAYASALVETLDFLAGAAPALPPVASGVGQIDLLRRRVTMIMRGSTPRMLGGLGFVAVLGLAALLLPLVPTWAQQEPPAAQRTDQPDQNRKMLDKAWMQWDRENKELEALKLTIDKLRTQLETSKAQSEQKARELKSAEVWLDPRVNGSGERGGNNPIPAMEKRMADLERKLDRVLDEIRTLRKAMDKGTGGGGSGKDGFGAGSGGFKSGIIGDFPLPKDESRPGIKGMGGER